VIRRIAIAVGIVVVTVVLVPIVEPMVDWGMDGDLTPGVWEPHHWLAGVFISALLLGVYVIPTALLTVIVVGIVAVRGGELHDRSCPACSAVIDPSKERCPACGPLPPRRPRRRSVAGLGVATWIVAQILGLVVLAVVIATGIGWVRLEREEDAFGERARAAARSGADLHEERNRHGSLLGWRREDGYWSHRD
jgi:hypothetical protein